MENEKWWYSYDPENFSYTGMVLAPEKPENATGVEIGGITNPKWNADTNSWVGESIDDQLSILKKNNENNNENPDAILTKTLADFKENTDLSISNLILQIAQLQEQISKAVNN